MIDKELIVAGVFVLAFGVMPFFRTELYPFSRAPMFADAPRLYCDYIVTDPEGQSLNLFDFGLQRNYWGNPLGVGVGFEPAPSMDTFGEVSSQDAITKQIRERLVRSPQLPYVEVSQTVIGPVDDLHVGPVSSACWRVDNPYYRGTAQ